MLLKVGKEFFTRFKALGVGVELLIKHEAKPSALSCNEVIVRLLSYVHALIHDSVKIPLIRPRKSLYM